MPFAKCAALAMLLVAAPLATDAAERVALLIGNSDYVQPSLALKNPRNDVRALGAALRAEDFSVFVASDLNVDEMRSALADFGAAADGAEMALFFYAGHGVQVAGENYLIGTDFNGTDTAALEAQSLTMSAVLQTLEESHPQAGLLFLDACRNTPFADNGMARPGLSRNRGGAGLMIAYATDPGNVALDGAGENSVFTTALLDNLATPGLDVRLMLGRVRQQVVLDTGGRQVPWVEEALLGEHVISTQVPEVFEADAVAEEVRRWRQISDSPDAAAFAAYLADYPEGMFAEVARDRIEALTRTAGATTTAADMQLAASDSDGVVAALAVLGLMPGDARATRSAPSELTTALSDYEAQFLEGEPASIDRLYSDATRRSMYLAALTAQRIRTDIVALRSVERTRNVARQALSDVAEIAQTNPAAIPILEQGQEDLAAIDEAWATIQTRLDESRGYYDELLGQTARFAGDSSAARAADLSRDSHLGAEGAAGFRKFEQLFLKHVAEVKDQPEGSYFWLSDLAEENG